MERLNRVAHAIEFTAIDFHRFSVSNWPTNFMLPPVHAPHRQPLTLYSGCEMHLFFEGR